MKNSILQVFATSIAFFAAAVGITVIMWAMEAAGYELIPGQQVENWFSQGLFTVAYALLSGFLVDSIRWVTTAVWVPRHRRIAGHKLRKTSQVAGLAR